MAQYVSFRYPRFLKTRVFFNCLILALERFFVASQLIQYDAFVTPKFSSMFVDRQHLVIKHQGFFVTLKSAQSRGLHVKSSKKVSVVA